MTCALCLVFVSSFSVLCVHTHPCVCPHLLPPSSISKHVESDHFLIQMRIIFIISFYLSALFRICGFQFLQRETLFSYRRLPLDMEYATKTEIHCVL